MNMTMNMTRIAICFLLIIGFCFGSQASIEKKQNLDKINEIKDTTKITAYKINALRTLAEKLQEEIHKCRNSGVRQKYPETSGSLDEMGKIDTGLNRFNTLLDKNFHQQSESYYKFITKAVNGYYDELSKIDKVLCKDNFNTENLYNTNKENFDLFQAQCAISKEKIIIKVIY